MPSNGGLIYHLTWYVRTLPWEDPKNHEFTSFKLQISVMVSIAVSKMGLTELIFVVPGMKVNGQHYPWCFTHFANAASNKACCKWYVCLSTRQRSISSCKDIIKQLQQETPDFIGPDLWPPNSPDLNLVDYKVWGVMQQRVYECRMNSGDELKQRLVKVWNSLQQNVVDAAINEWRKKLRACMHAMENILNIYCERVWLTKVMDK